MKKILLICFFFCVFAQAKAENIDTSGIGNIAGLTPLEIGEMILTEKSDVTFSMNSTSCDSHYLSIYGFDSVPCEEGIAQKTIKNMEAGAYILSINDDGGDTEFYVSSVEYVVSPASNSSNNSSVGDVFGNINDYFTSEEDFLDFIKVQIGVYFLLLFSVFFVKLIYMLKNKIGKN